MLKCVVKQNLNTMIVKNRVEYDTVYSNLVYPDWTNKDKFFVLGKIDHEFVIEELERLFEATSIANKYAIQMPDDVLWYRHDFSVLALRVVGNL